MNTELQKTGVSRSTVLFASGDSGVNCRRGALTPKFYPNWPASSPYLTTVDGRSSTNRVRMMGSPTNNRCWTNKKLFKSICQARKLHLRCAYLDVSAFAVDFTIYYQHVETKLMVQAVQLQLLLELFLNDVRLN